MVETTHAATNSSVNYQDLALTLVKMWDLYSTQYIAVFVVLLLATIIFVIRKSSWGTLFLFLTILAGASIIALDGLKQYVAEQRKAVIKGIILAPVNQVGKLIKGIFTFGK